MTELLHHLSQGVFVPHANDSEYILRYCSHILGSDSSLKDMMNRVRLLRFCLPALIGPPIDARTRPGCFLLTDSSSVGPVVAPVAQGDTTIDYSIQTETIAHEVFRQILAPRLDPLNKQGVELVCFLRDSRKEEIDRLRDRCMSLAEEIRVDDGYGVQTVQKLIRTKANKEISDLLSLDRRTAEDFFVSLFSDEKIWLGLSGFIVSLLSGQPVALTAGTFIATISCVGPKLVKALDSRWKHLRASDFALLYHIAKHQA